MKEKYPMISSLQFTGNDISMSMYLYQYDMMKIFVFRWYSVYMTMSSVCTSIISIIYIASSLHGHFDINMTEGSTLLLVKWQRSYISYNHAVLLTVYSKHHWMIHCRKKQLAFQIKTYKYPLKVTKISYLLEEITMQPCFVVDLINMFLIFPLAWQSV